MAGHPLSLITFIYLQSVVFLPCHSSIYLCHLCRYHRQNEGWGGGTVITVLSSDASVQFSQRGFGYAYWKALMVTAQHGCSFFKFCCDRTYMHGLLLLAKLFSPLE